MAQRELGMDREGLLAHSRLPERERFDVFLTGDENMHKQLRLEGRPLGVLILSAIDWPVIRSHIHNISDALDKARPGTVEAVDCGVFIARSKRPSE